MIVIEAENLKHNIDIDSDEEYLIIVTKPLEIDVNFNIVKSDITLKVFGIVSMSGNDVATLKIKTTHIAPSAKSKVEVKSVMYDSAIFNFEGMIYIDKLAQLSDAYLQNDNLIVGDDAKVNSAPQLEILADDVKASHGVTITSFDEDYIFYLKSRGIDTGKSQELIIHGFLSDVIKGVRMDELIEYKIPGLIYEEN